MKNTLLSTPSSKDLFSEDVILASLTQVKDESRLSLLKKLSSLKGEGKAASTSSSSSRGCSSKSFCSSKCSASSLPSRRKKVAFKGILYSPTLKKGFSK